MIQQTIELTLAKLLGLPVRIGKLNVSLLAGSFDAGDVRIGDERWAIDIARISGKISIGKAMSKQASIKSMEIEGVRVAIHSIPKKKLPGTGPSTTSWRAEAQIVSLRDAEIGLPFLGLSIKQITGELREVAQESNYKFDFSGSLHGEQSAAAFPLRMSGRFVGVTDLLKVASSPIEMQIQLDQEPPLEIRIASRKMQVRATGPVHWETICQFLPLPLPAGMIKSMRVGIELEIEF